MVLLLSTVSALPALARPVSYPGGWTLMVRNDIIANSTLVHYSPTAKHSVGWRHEYLREPSAHVNSVQLNNLLKRWNKTAEQANIYLKSGVGIALENGDVNPAIFTGIAADWETRRHFISYENRFFWADDTDQFIRHEARMGIAPYIGDHGDFHTWLMLQANYNASDQDNFSATPLVRFLKDATLVELGYNLDNGIEANFTQRF